MIKHGNISVNVMTMFPKNAINISIPSSIFFHKDKAPHMAAFCVCWLWHYKDTSGLTITDLSNCFARFNNIKGDNSHTLHSTDLTPRGCSDIDNYYIQKAMGKINQSTHAHYESCNEISSKHRASLITEMITLNYRDEYRPCELWFTEISS